MKITKKIKKSAVSSANKNKQTTHKKQLFRDFSYPMWMNERMKWDQVHLLLVVWISYFQLIYDGFCFTANDAVTYNLNAVSVCFRLFAFGTSLNISNWMCFIALRVIYAQKILNAYDYFSPIMISSMTLGTIFALIYGIAAIPESKRNDDLASSIIDVSYNFRNGCIFVNFLFSCLIFHKIYQTSSKMKTRKSDPYDCSPDCLLPQSFNS